MDFNSFLLSNEEYENDNPWRLANLRQNPINTSKVKTIIGGYLKNCNLNKVSGSFGKNSIYSPRSTSFLQQTRSNVSLTTNQNFFNMSEEEEEEEEEEKEKEEEEEIEELTKQQQTQCATDSFHSSSLEDILVHMSDYDQSGSEQENLSEQKHSFSPFRRTGQLGKRKLPAYFYDNSLLENGQEIVSDESNLDDQEEEEEEEEEEWNDSEIFHSYWSDRSHSERKSKKKKTLQNSSSILKEATNNQSYQITDKSLKRLRNPKKKKSFKNNQSNDSSRSSNIEPREREMIRVCDTEHPSEELLGDVKTIDVEISNPDQHHSENPLVTKGNKKFNVHEITTKLSKPTKHTRNFNIRENEHRNSKTNTFERINPSLMKEEHVILVSDDDEPQSNDRLQFARQKNSFVNLQRQLKCFPDKSPQTNSSILRESFGQKTRSKSINLPIFTNQQESQPNANPLKLSGPYRSVKQKTLPGMSRFALLSDKAISEHVGFFLEPRFREIERLMANNTRISPVVIDFSSEDSPWKSLRNHNRRILVLSCMDMISVEIRSTLKHVEFWKYLVYRFINFDSLVKRERRKGIPSEQIDIRKSYSGNERDVIDLVEEHQNGLRETRNQYLGKSQEFFNWCNEDENRRASLINVHQTLLGMLSFHDIVELSSCFQHLLDVSISNNIGYFDPIKQWVQTKIWKKFGYEHRTNEKHIFGNMVVHFQSNLYCIILDEWKSFSDYYAREREAKKKDQMDIRDFIYEKDECINRTNPHSDSNKFENVKEFIQLFKSLQKGRDTEFDYNWDKINVNNLKEIINLAREWVVFGEFLEKYACLFARILLLVLSNLKTQLFCMNKTYCRVSFINSSKWFVKLPNMTDQDVRETINPSLLPRATKIHKKATELLKEFVLKQMQLSSFHSNVVGPLDTSSMIPLENSKQTNPAFFSSHIRSFEMLTQTSDNQIETFVTPLMYMNSRLRTEELNADYNLCLQRENNEQTFVSGDYESLPIQELLNYQSVIVKIINRFDFYSRLDRLILCWIKQNFKEEPFKQNCSTSRTLATNRANLGSKHPSTRKQAPFKPKTKVSPLHVNFDAMIYAVNNAKDILSTIQHYSEDNPDIFMPVSGYVIDPERLKSIIFESDLNRLYNKSSNLFKLVPLENSEALKILRSNKIL